MEKYKVSGSRIVHDDGRIEEQLLYSPIGTVEPPPPDDKPIPSDRLKYIMGYSGAEIGRQDPLWPANINEKWAPNGNSKFIRDWDRENIPGQPGTALRVQASWTPIIQPDGRLTFDFTSSEGRMHAQWSLQRPGDRNCGMAFNSVYFAQGAAYVVEFTLQLDQHATWIQLFQGYGRHGGDDQVDDAREQLAVFVCNGKLSLQTRNTEGVAIKTPEDKQPSISTGQPYLYRLEFRASGSGTDYAKLFCAPFGQPLGYVDTQLGPIGSGGLMDDHNEYLDNRFGAYATKGTTLTGFVYSAAYYLVTSG